MRRARVAAFLVSPVLALALALIGLLPPEHLHLASIEGGSHSVVHRHSLEDSGSGPVGTAIAAHGDHHRALFLSSVYNSISRFVPQTPAVVVAAVVIVPSPDPLVFVQTEDARLAHGPPKPSSLTRAPPFLAYPDSITV